MENKNYRQKKEEIPRIVKLISSVVGVGFLIYSGFCIRAHWHYSHLDIGIDEQVSAPIVETASEPATNSSAIDIFLDNIPVADIKKRNKVYTGQAISVISLEDFISKYFCNVPDDEPSNEEIRDNLHQVRIQLEEIKTRMEENEKKPYTVKIDGDPVVFFNPVDTSNIEIPKPLEFDKVTKKLLKLTGYSAVDKKMVCLFVEYTGFNAGQIDYLREYFSSDKKALQSLDEFIDNTKKKDIEKGLFKQVYCIQNKFALAIPGEYIKRQDRRHTLAVRVPDGETDSVLIFDYDPASDKVTARDACEKRPLEVLEMPWLWWYNMNKPGTVSRKHSKAFFLPLPEHVRKQAVEYMPAK